MKQKENINIIGYIGEFLLTFATVPLLIQLIKTKNADSFNEWFIIISLVGLGLRLIFSLYKRTNPVTLSTVWQLVEFTIVAIYKFN